MLFWAIDNPPPANYLLISGDRDFSNCLHQLRMRRYNILLAQPPNVSQALVAAAKSVWHWKSILAGGVPIEDSASPYLGNVSTSKTSNSEEGKNTKGEPIPGSLNMGSGNSYGDGRADNLQEKQAWRNQAQSDANISRTSSTEFCHRSSKAEENGNSYVDGRADNWQEKQAWTKQAQPNNIFSPMMSKPVAQESTQSKYTIASCPSVSPRKPHNQPSFSHKSDGVQVNAIPHEFFGFNKLKTVEEPSSNKPPQDVQSSNSSKTQLQHPQRLVPTESLPSQPSQAAGNTIRSNSHISNSRPPPPRFSAPTFRPGPPARLPHISSLEVSEYSRSFDQYRSFPQQSSRPYWGPQSAPPYYYDNAARPLSNSMDYHVSNNGAWGSAGCPMPPDVAQGLVRSILQALEELRSNKMTPTEANISDCIRYGKMGIQNFDVRMALGYVVQHDLVSMHALGSNLPFYIKKGEKLWRCVNPLDITVQHSNETWDAVKNFVSSAPGHAAILASESRYHAAAILHRGCLGHFVLGEVLQILNVLVTVKKWITPFQYGWRPVSITLGVAPDSSADIVSSS
ncbi:uncharacterized protein M6B38_176200 [Iris pallida]|uniref:NYN domain-containing protein n=1 Tax=Iris pallida TaxID=29817 RepID=A0AAX6EQ09_IRIPA|nr:uncharacterized protein M6B38_176200 [Iris pallida]